MSLGLFGEEIGLLRQALIATEMDVNVHFQTFHSPSAAL